MTLRGVAGVTLGVVTGVTPGSVTDVTLGVVTGVTEDVLRDDCALLCPSRTVSLTSASGPWVDTVSDNTVMALVCTNSAISVDTVLGTPGVTNNDTPINRSRVDT